MMHYLTSAIVLMNLVLIAGQELRAQNVDVDVVRVEEFSTTVYVVRVGVTTTYNGTALLIDDDVLAAQSPDRTQDIVSLAERLRETSAMADTTAARVASGAEVPASMDLPYRISYQPVHWIHQGGQALVSRSLRIVRNENLPLQVRVQSGYQFDGQWYEARSLQTRMFWLNDGTRNPGGANELDSDLEHTVWMYHRPMSIRSLPGGPNTLSAFLILETELDNVLELVQTAVLDYTVRVTLEY